MTWVILTGRKSDLDKFETPHKIITNRDYLTHPSLFRAQRPKIINLSGSYAYQSRGYYASLLAGSRGHRIIPSVETMIDLSEKKLYEASLPELEQTLNRCRKELGGTFPTRIGVFFGIGPSKAWDRFARLLFDWYRAPALEVTIRDNGEWASIGRIGFLPLARMKEDEKTRFLDALNSYTAREWRDKKQRTPSRYSFATLVDPKEELPPSSIASLKYWSRIAAKMGVEVEPISRRDLPKLANYDALFIRETTTISNHTYRFARRAQQEGMPVIDDPLSMIRCTNKVYLNELMDANKVPVPPTVMIAGAAAIEIHHKHRAIFITGDAMGRPMLDALESGRPGTGEKYDLSSLFAMASSAALFSPALKERFLDLMPNTVVTDSIGLDESKKFDRLTVLSVGELLAKAIRFTHSEQSVSSLFD